MVIKNVWELNDKLWVLVEETWLYSNERWSELHKNLLLIVKSVLRKSDIVLDRSQIEKWLSTPLDQSKRFEISAKVDEYLMYEGSLESFTEWFNTWDKKVFEAIIVWKLNNTPTELRKVLRDIKAAAQREKKKFHPRLNKLILALIKWADFDEYIKELVAAWRIQAKQITMSPVYEDVVRGFKEILGDTIPNNI